MGWVVVMLENGTLTTQIHQKQFFADPVVTLLVSKRVRVPLRPAQETVGLIITDNLLFLAIPRQFAAQNV